MPIRPENKNRYPKDWPAISARIRERDGNRCKWCGVPNGQLGGRSDTGAWEPATPLGDNGLRLQWPKEGSWSWCLRGDGAQQQRRIVRIVLTTAHLNHKPEDCRDENLAALCQRCHNRYDAPMRRAGMQARARSLAALGDLFTQPQPNDA